MIYLFLVFTLFGKGDYYTGEGIAHYGDKKTIDEAIEDAKKNAREDLAKNIKVVVKSTVIRTIGEDAEMVSDKFKKFIQEKSKVVLQGVEYSDTLIDTEKKAVTITARILKRVYDKKVEEDLKEKKSRIIQYYRESEEDLKKGFYTLALKSLYRARGYIWIFFKDLPINGDLNRDGKEDEELKAAVQGKIDRLIGELTFEPVNKKLLFTSTGNVTGNVGFHIYWKEKGVYNAVGNFPVYASFVKGKGEIVMPEVTTDNTGYAELDVENIDPSYSNVVIKIKPLIEKFFGIIPFSEGKKDEAITQLKKELGVLPEWNINITKKKSLALSVYAVSGKKRFILSNIRNEVEEIIRGKGYDVVDKNIMSTPDIEKMKALKEQGFDYICIIKVSVHSEYISDFEMYMARASGIIKLYSTVEKTEVQSIPAGTTKKKFAVDRSTAVWNAIGALRSALIRKVKLLNL